MTLKNYPARMYKYLANDRIDVIKNCIIRYSCLGDFNDPFEGQPNIQLLVSAEQAKSIIKEQLRIEAARQFQEIPSSEEAWISSNEILELLLEKVENDALELHGYIEEQRSAVLDKISAAQKDVAALCLSEVPDSLLMWAHYANSHSGFVLEFNTHHPYFHNPVTELDDFRQLQRIQYREARPTGNLIDLDVHDFFNVKSGHWSYEREWRIMRALVDADKTIECGESKVHLFNFPPDALTSVIFGARTPITVIDEVKNIVTSQSELNHVCLKQAKPDDSHFLLRIAEYENHCGIA